MTHSVQARIAQLGRWLVKGTERYPDPGDSRRAQITIAIALTYVLLLMPYIPVYLWIGVATPAVALGGVIASYFAAWGLARGGTTRDLQMARVLFITSYSGSVVLFSGFLGHGTGIHLLHYPGACLAFLICSLRERWLIAYCVAICVLGNLAVEVGRDVLFPPPLFTSDIQFGMYLALIPSTFGTMLLAVFHFARSSTLAEARVEGRNQDLQRILDTIDQGLMTVGLDGAVCPERSGALVRWFGEPRPQESVWAYLGRAGADLDTWEVAWQQIGDGFLPLDVCLDQLPRRLDVGDRNLSFAYRVVDTEGADQVLIVVTDITVELARARSEQIGRETVELFERMMKGRRLFLDFFEESAAQVQQLALDDTDRPTTLRLIHTLKGTCALMGVASVANACHEVESAVAERDEAPTSAERERIVAAWTGLSERLEILVGQGVERLEVSRADYEEVRDAVARQATLREISEILEGWTLERGSERLAGLAEQARAVARRCGKEVEVEVVADGTRFPQHPWSAFWPALVHVVRNCIDHGLEPVDARLLALKPAVGRLRMTVGSTSGERVITIGDDGRGIDWDSVRERARAAGLPHERQEDLEAALFHDGLSTRAEVTMLSGRGVGMGAVRAACLAAGGSIHIDTARGQGTRFTFRFPPASARQTRAA